MLLEWSSGLPSVFFSYSHEDEGHRDQLEKQLAMLKRQGVIETWHDRRIGPGRDFVRAIDERINKDQIILLLVSADFLASDYCYDIEMKRAMERHHAGDAVVIPVILRACEWNHAPFGNLNATPRDGKPIKQWPDIDEAFLQVAKAVRQAAEDISGKTKSQSPSAKAVSQVGPVQIPTMGPRSSNLRLAKSFTQRDKDKFQSETFDFIARYFENSLHELSARNRGFEGVFRHIDANRFFATIYHEGKDVARATVFMGGGLFARGISYLQGESLESNAMNESLTVNADDQMLYLTAMGMSFGREREQKLSQEGAAELFWGILIGPLQQQRR
jgi:hypothetical protein